MNDFTTHFKKQAERITLSEAERSRIRHSVLGAPAPTLSPFSFRSLYMSRGVAAALALVLIASGAGSTLYAAESALPGDPLYAIKTEITEPLSGALALTHEAEDAWHERLATRRLSEAEALAKEGRLDEENSRELALAFSAHADTLEDSDAAAMSTGMTAEAFDETAQNATERLRAAVAATGASILEATVNTDDIGRIASAHFVLSVLGEESDEAPASARLMKGSDTPADAMLSLSAPAIEVENLEELSQKAKRVFAEATGRVETDRSAQMRAELAALLPLLVQAEAELITGKEEDARMHFTAVIDGAGVIGVSEMEPETPDEILEQIEEGTDRIDSMLPN